MIGYLIKSCICLVVLLVIYHALLEKEKMHKFNRYFLLFGLVFSFTIPLLTLEITSEPVSVLQLTNRIEALSSEPANYSPAPTFRSDEITTPAETSDITFLLIVYALGASIMAFRFSRNLYLLYSRIKSNPRISHPKGTLVLLEDCGVPHSFFKYIFVDEQLYKSGNIDEAVYKHEQTHARQKHSVDILFIEVLKIAFWFNPALYFYKKAIQLNHEYLADESVISDSTDLQSYQKLLLKLQSGEKNMQLASSIHYSITKKRIMMMTKNTTRLNTLGKQLMLIPLLAGLVFAFSSRTAPAQDVQSMTLTELIEALNKKMETVDSLSTEEQEALSSLVEKMRNMLIEKYNKRIAPLPPKEVKNNPTSPEPPKEINQIPPPPAPTPKSENPKITLKKYAEVYSKHVKAYNNILAVKKNKEELEAAYEKVMILYNAVDSLQKEVYENDPPPPPLPFNPIERIEANSKSKVDTTQLN